MHCSWPLDLCSFCQTALLCPFILCSECIKNTPICLKCFASGQESDEHRNYHEYQVIKLDYPILAEEWTAEEELLFVQALFECGFGNWDDISKQLGSKSKDECSEHFDLCCLPVIFPDFSKKKEGKFGNLNRNESGKIDYFEKHFVYQELVQPLRPSQFDPLYLSYSGYSAARNDFGAEYRNKAEFALNHVEYYQRHNENNEAMNETSEEDAELRHLDHNLQKVVFDSYLRTVNERTRRKRLIRKRGLICPSQLLAFNNLIASNWSRLLAFQGYLSNEDYDKFVETFLYEHELNDAIEELKTCRRNGLRHLYSVPTFRRLSNRRNEYRNKRRHLLEILSHLKDNTTDLWLQQQALKDQGLSTFIPRAKKRIMRPLDIQSEPGFELLSDREKEVCSSARLVPQFFVEMKEKMIEACRDKQTLRLADARPMFKIDVNKTRKVYDYLLEEKLIWCNQEE